MDTLHRTLRLIRNKADKQPMNPFPVVYLRCVDAGTDCECWVVCAKNDPGAVQFERS